MDTNTNINDSNEPAINAEEIDTQPAEAGAAAEAEATEERSHGRGRGRRGMRGRRPFGPNRPYRFALFVEDDGSYVLRSPDLDDRVAEVESLDDIGDTLRAAIEQRAAEDAALAAEAEKDAEYSGKFVLRLPRSMHRQLTELAETEGVSLNQLALSFLAEGLGRAETIHEFGERRGKHRGPRGGHGPGGHGPGGRGPWGRGPRGDRGPEGPGPERDFGGRHDRNGRGHRGRPGCGPEAGEPGRHGFRRARWFMRETVGPDSSTTHPAPDESSFV